MKIIFCTCFKNKFARLEANFFANFILLKIKHKNFDFLFSPNINNIYIYNYINNIYYI